MKFKETGPQQVPEQKKKVQCVSCRREVEVTLIPFGGGYIATCPECGQLAYNSKEKPL